MLHSADKFAHQVRLQRGTHPPLNAWREIGFAFRSEVRGVGYRDDRRCRLDSSRADFVSSVLIGSWTVTQAVVTQARGSKGSSH